MKTKRIYLTISLLVLPIMLMAQANELKNFMNNVVKPFFPVAAGIVFIGGALLNLGHFFGENRDIKKGVINIVIYLGALFLIRGILAAIISFKL